MVRVRPQALKAGDVIRFVTPASPIEPHHLENISRILTEAGYRVEVGPHAMDRDFYLAGKDEDRARDLMDAFLDPGVAAVFCSRGGYGCARLMPYLDLDAMAASSKLFLGFSDVTTLHAALNRRGLPTLHSPMGITLATEREPWVVESLLRALRGEDPVVQAAPKGETITPGVAEGTVAGGCLCLITDSIATADEVPFDDAILLIEDVDEWPHRVDAMLTHLILSGRIQRCRGIVIGEMTRTDDTHEPTIGKRPWREIVRDRIAPLGIPAILNFPFGHAPQMLTLPLGVRAQLDAGAGTLTYVESVCG